MERAHWAALLTVCALSSAYAWRHRTHRPIAVYLLTLALCDALRAVGALNEGLDRLAFLAPPVVLLGAVAAVLRHGPIIAGAIALGPMLAIEASGPAVSASALYTLATATVLLIGGGGLVWEMRKGKR